MEKTTYKNPLHKTVSTTPTDIWNDSCAVGELTYAIENGAVGATTNPVIVVEALKKEMHLWKDRLQAIINAMPAATEEEIAWKLNEEMAVKGAELLRPVFEREKGKKGRISIQTNSRYYRNADYLLKQAIHFHSLAPNIQVKIPVTKAGLAAIEEATCHGVNVNATVCFTVSQSLAAGEAVERGLKRRQSEGKDIALMSPVCTLMAGRLDDWLKVVAEKQNIITDPGYLEWAGVAALKRAYRIYKERGFKTRMLAAAYRNHFLWSELIGGDVVLTIPYKWQRRFNSSDVEVKPRMDDPVDEKIITELLNKFEDFKKAYEPDGLSIDEFDTYGPTVRTLRQFLGGLDLLLTVIRDFMLPDPGV
ncbi:MAG: transaldolase family protein [Spirochaetota bacterium]